VRVNGVEGIDPQLVSLQFESVYTDIGVDAVKTGMLLNGDIVRVVAKKFKECRIPHIVVDPVMIAKGGDPLLLKEAVDMVKTELVPVCTLITPNIPEAEVLAEMKIQTAADLREAALKIHKLGAPAVLIKGGHAKGDAVDVLFDGDSFSRFTAPRIDSLNTHGTGCTYSAAIASCLAREMTLKEAIHTSKQFITRAIEGAFNLGKGHGPLNHFVKAL
jgi:hydroxymethylpyrimidine kinase/phosphomethylpyrimidine kinase